MVVSSKIMPLFQAIILAAVQGLTEFLPVSSSGHLVIFQKVFNFRQPPVFFDILLHLGTSFSVIIFFRREIFALIKKGQKSFKKIFFLILGTLPAAAFGFFLNSRTEALFNSLPLVGLGLLFTGLLLVSTKLINPGKAAGLTALDAVIVGFFQAAAIIPGISRSGTTVTAGLWRNLNYNAAFTFSFLLSLPAIAGAVVLQVPEISLTAVNLPVAVVSMVVAGTVGYLALAVLKKALLARKLPFFGLYCLAVGAVLLILG